jgi:hypothetical protein
VLIFEEKQDYPEHEKFAHEGLTSALVNALETALVGTDPQFWYTGVISAIQDLTAEQASRTLLPGYSTIAAHAEHIRVSLNYVRRTFAGETLNIEWWPLQMVDTAQWEELKQQLQAEYEATIAFVKAKSFWREEGLTQMLDSLAHIAYHAGAIRQLAKGV